MRLQRVGHDLVSEQQQKIAIFFVCLYLKERRGLGPPSDKYVFQVQGFQKATHNWGTFFLDGMDLCIERLSSSIGFY